MNTLPLVSELLQPHEVSNDKRIRKIFKRHRNNLQFVARCQLLANANPSWSDTKIETEALYKPFKKADLARVLLFDKGEL